MSRFQMHDFRMLDKSPTSPNTLTHKIGQMIDCSTNFKCWRESYNKETGEYKVVLQGTLEVEDTKWDWG
jgi:hypothetical protein